MGLFPVIFLQAIPRSLNKREAIVNKRLVKSGRVPLSSEKVLCLDRVHPIFLLEIVLALFYIPGLNSQTTLLGRGTTRHENRQGQREASNSIFVLKQL
jgi:hypothetical protein